MKYFGVSILTENSQSKFAFKAYRIEKIFGEIEKMISFFDLSVEKIFIEEITEDNFCKIKESSK